ncbi:Cold shock domain,Nucleic acid-binding, OB-fold,Cold-shock protein, DNA-binding,Zinc finger, CCHC- [Cinara cedri]|uniref:Cold shock domain,Nucleic acid-binding, OB-fold,Cold-shock protein, DNA-binding,Zinc finger, CCHC n=1 Tax=Cinara cedri TaxID=506608 RepID=A0A5E4N516_9HEMI|nr:Cold shock domain,Nucleic acid-binding, OB-fold,Cold-shock protein, DNA-binding,Zinc finger, CCHC- [Cinara cedri]
MSENITDIRMIKIYPNGDHIEDVEDPTSKISHLKDLSIGTNTKPSNNGNDSQSSTDIDIIKLGSFVSKTEELPEGIRRGICKWFNSKKGFGFVTPDDGGKDIFVHQRVIKKDGFRSLRENELVEFSCHESDKGLEATLVTGPGGQFCKGSKKVYPAKILRCYNCGDFANHIAAKCTLGPMPKRCHSCKASDHLIADCPNAQPRESTNKLTKNQRKRLERSKFRLSKSKQVEGTADEKKPDVPNQNGDEIDDIQEKKN